MMKTSFLVACVLLSVSAAPAPEPAKGGEKSAKLQFTPGDSQLYSTAVGGNQLVVPESTVLRVQDAIIPQSVHHSRSVYQTVAGSPLYAPAPAVVPYSSTGRTTITTTGQPGSLPDGYVWEHQGTSHIGHTSQAVHVKKQSGLAYANPAYSVAGIPVAAYPGYQTGYQTVIQTVPQTVTSYALSAPARHGEVRIVNGRHAQYLNNQWFYISPEAAATAGAWNGAWNQAALNSPALSPALQTVVLANGQRVNTYATGAIPRHQAVDNKWYTKTNIAPAAQPFYAQAPQYVQTSQSAVRTVETESEKDW